MESSNKNFASDLVRKMEYKIEELKHQIEAHKKNEEILLRSNQEQMMKIRIRDEAIATLEKDIEEACRWIAAWEELDMM